MTQPMKRPLTEAELRRAEDCADENAKLAECWESQQVAIATCERSDHLNRYAGYQMMPVLTIDTLLPIEQPAADVRRKQQQQQQQTKRQVAERTIRELHKVKENKWAAPRPCYYKYRSHERFDMYTQEARIKAAETFDALAKQYVTVCIAGYDLRETRRGMESLRIDTPPRVVWVDLMKVLEHQTRETGIPAELRKYTDDNVTVRHGRYDRRPGEPQGEHGMPSVRLLEVLGPAAASHRADFKKAEKESVALKRIANRARNGIS